MAQTWRQPESTCPRCLSAAGTEVLVPGPGPREEPGKVGGTGDGPITAVLEKCMKEYSEKRPQKNKQGPRKHSWPLANRKETLSVITSSSFILKIRELRGSLQWG